jgi:hypothetical protein
LRDSLLRNESPTQRLDLMMQERLQQLRSAPLRTGGAVMARRSAAATTMLASALHRPRPGQDAAGVAP